MATVTRAESKHMYSWWWDSHISPKNSKWLHENLADTDTKVKQMIKLVEVDEDSFARRAEMYYKKRPELMKLIEEFYRAYRALAERYDHATGVIKQAHKTMAQVFPNHVPCDASDDGSFSFTDSSDPHTPETSFSIREFCELDEFSHDESHGFFSKIAEGRARKSLTFQAADEMKVQILKNEGGTEKAQALSESERLGRSETDIQALKEALDKLEAEKEAGLLEYQESMWRLSKLESEVMRAQEDSSGLHERASKAEAEVQTLKDSLAKLEGEREASLQQYQQCLERISSLESSVSHAREDAERLNKQVCKAEEEALIFREELLKLTAEKEVCLAKYMEALEKIANLENKLLLAEDKASITSKRACTAEKEVAVIKEAFERATEENEAVSLQCQKFLERVASLESEIALSHEVAARLKDEVDQGAAKLKVSEEQCLLLVRSNKSMQDELDSFLNKLGAHNQELAEKQKELVRLWTCVQEEHLRFLQAETSLRTLQSLHSQTQEELRSVADELQRRVQLMKDMEIHGQSLQEELQKVRNENKSLNEINISSAVSMTNMHDEILNLKEGKDKLEGDLEVGLVERNVLQQEIYCLKKELNSLNKAYQHMLEQVRLVGLQPDSIGSSFKDLQDESTRTQLEEVIDKAVNSEFENLILRNIIHALKETNSSLVCKCEKLLESSKLSEKLILELEFENIEQQEEENFLSEQIKKLRMGIFQFLKVLSNADLELVYEGNLVEDEIVLHRIFIKLDEMRNALCKAWDVNQKLIVEKSVLETLHEQLKKEMADLKVLINSLQLEFRNGNNQLSSLHKDMPKLLQSHEELILRVTEGNQKEDLLADEVNNLRAKLLKMQDISRNLKKEHCKILGEKHELEYENSGLVAKTVTLDTLSLIFKNSVLDRSEMIYQLAQDVERLCDDKSVLEDKVRIMVSMLDKYEKENLNLKHSLEKFDDELQEVGIANSQLELALASEREEFSQKEMELLEARMVEDDQGKQIIRLSVENESLRVSKQYADAEMHRIISKQTQTEKMMDMLHSELEKGKVEAELWETVAGSFFIELQTASVREALFSEKLSELTKEYERLEAENHSKCSEFEHVNERLKSFEGENSLVKAQLTQLIPALAALRDSVASLESHAIHSDSEDSYYKSTASSHKANTDEEVAGATSDGFSDLQEIAVRMKAIENKVMEMKKLSQERSLKALKSRSSRSRRGVNRSSKLFFSETAEKLPAKENHHRQPALMMKDIVLDQASETSSRDDQFLELWETIEVDKQEVPKRFKEADNNNKKVLESLASDVQRLANLQITVQDLKQKVVITDSSNPAKGKGIEYIRVRDQLHETDMAISKLLEVNGKLRKKVDDLSSNSLIADSPEAGGESKRRTDVYEQARRCAQKIGRLQLEVQKIQFVLLNLDQASYKMGRGPSGTRVPERNSRILLKDYLGPRTPRRRKKTHFCGCVHPPTSGE